MARFTFTGHDEIDELLDSVLYGVWVVLAVIGGAYALLTVTAQPQKDVLSFFFFFTVAGLVFVPMMDRVEAAGGQKALTWALIGFGGLILIAFVSNIFVISSGLSAKYLNFLELSVLATLGLSTTTLFGTLYFVATGEENLKALGFILFNLFEPIEDFFGFQLPDTLAAQPLVWGIVGMWSVAHTVLGQNPWWYAIPVFVDGLWLMHVATKGESWIAPIFAHFLNNAAFLSMRLLG